MGDEPLLEADYGGRAGTRLLTGSAWVRIVFTGPDGRRVYATASTTHARLGEQRRDARFDKRMRASEDARHALLRVVQLDTEQRFLSEPVRWLVSSRWSSDVCVPRCGRGWRSVAWHDLTGVGDWA